MSNFTVYYAVVGYAERREQHSFGMYGYSRAHVDSLGTAALQDSAIVTWEVWDEQHTLACDTPVVQ